MIKINLLSERKLRRTHTRGRELMGVGALAIIAAGAAVFVVVHNPLRGALEELEVEADQLEQENEQLEEATADFEDIEDALDSLAEREAAIEALNEAKATPAWLLKELAAILSPAQRPTMDEAAAARVARGAGGVWDDEWDPRRVWIRSFSERDGAFTLEAAASSDTDMTQLALRLEVSAYFEEVLPQGGDTTTDRDSGISFHEFVITGEVRY